MLRMMSVKENILFSARYRLPAGMSDEEISSRVHEVMSVLGLTDIMYSPIGDERQRGISGGQRKRVNIGMELVADPSILFLDEPTSGLDSTSSEEVCNCLKRISRLGITVATVIHQPRYEIYEMFDNVLLLGKGGRTVYIGPTKEALPYFQGLGFILPPHGNPSDFFMDVIAGKCSKYTPQKMTARSMESLSIVDLQRFLTFHGFSDETAEEIASRSLTGTKLKQLPKSDIEQIFEKHSDKILDIIQNPTNYDYPVGSLDFGKDFLFQEWSRKSGVANQSRRTTNPDDDDFDFPLISWLLKDIRLWMIDIKETFSVFFKDDPYRKTPSFFHQLKYCMIRSFIQTYRDKYRIALDSCLHLFAGYFLGLSCQGLQYVGPIAPELEEFCPYELLHRNKCSLPLEDNFVPSGNLLCWGIGFAGIAMGASTFGNEKVVYWRDASSGLNPLSYHLAKIITDLPRVFLSGSLFFLTFIFVFSPVGRVDHLYLLILVLYWAGFSSGYFISQLVHVEIAPLVGIAFALIWAVVFSGSNPRLTEVEESYGSSSMFFWDISYARWGVEAFYAINIQVFSYVEVDAGLDFWGFEMDRYGECIGRIIGICIMWQFISLVCMLFKDRDKKK
eukprot:TRINITY_DN2972_c0_g1_i2.p1 TRINITY_DN2972_c0_g1~~TRINITY_DN2972_c0_g1_i2.p1  ORF type:complete len:617 (+),score=88.14 TRINITY_DN2972_c0_g1_i2:1091-2941(+)